MTAPDPSPQPVTPLTRAYPLPRPQTGTGTDDTDPRFTYGLIFDIADILQLHGYPPPVGGDWPHLMLALHRALHQPPHEDRP